MAPGKKSFKALEASKLVGKLARLTEGAPWARYLVSHMYTSIAFALAQNKSFLESTSEEFRTLARQIDKKNFRSSTSKVHEKLVRFALKKAARMVHQSKEEYYIVDSMREELDFFEQYLRHGSGVSWEAPIAFLIPRMPTASTAGDSCLEEGGGWSTELLFLWHIVYPDEVVKRTIKYLCNNAESRLISINVLEFIVVIINWCAAATVIQKDNSIKDPFPIILNSCDNTSAHSWTTHACKSSKLGKLLARFFCCLLMDSRLGINSKWISTTDNYIADDISRLKKLHADSSQHFSFDYSSLQQKHPELKNCRFFRPEPELLSMIWEIVLREKLPSLKQVRTLKQSGLGKLIS